MSCNSEDMLKVSVAERAALSLLTFRNSLRALLNKVQSTLHALSPCPSSLSISPLSLPPLSLRMSITLYGLVRTYDINLSHNVEALLSHLMLKCSEKA